MNPIVVSPFANSDIRDWPVDHYRVLIGLLSEARPETIHVIGSAGQATRARFLVRSFDPVRVVNDCGRLAWPASEALVRRAACVIGNNSGIAHLAASAGVPTICIFSGAHRRAEWRPIGRNVVTLSRTLACAPCGFHHAADCPFGVACLDQIAPETVAETALRLLARLSVAEVV